MHLKARSTAAVFLVSAIAAAPASAPRYLTFSEARGVLAAFDRSDDAAAWDSWVRKQDREVRTRIERGVEDSISNLILYGTSFTRLPRLDSAEVAVDSAGELTGPARARVHDAAVALARPEMNERLRFAREFLSRRGVKAAEMEALLGDNLRRFAREQRDYQEKLESSSQAGNPDEALFVRSTLFDRRGLSVDTSLLPNYALEDTLRVMLRKGALQPGLIRNIAIVGPGLDFVDKREGYDFYPEQTIQPFAILEAVIRLGLGDPARLHVVTLDLNPAVNSHVRRLAERARAGKPYVLELPRDEAADWTPAAMDYWRHFGDRIGSPATPEAAPKGLAIRAVAVQPKYALRIEARDVDIVAQVIDDQQFDLVVATNILLYYDRFQQAVAMASIAHMMSPGGVFLSNTVLPAEHSEDLKYLGRRSVSYSVSGSYGDDVVVYRRTVGKRP